MAYTASFDAKQVEVSFHRSVSCAATSNAALCRIRLLLECPAQLLPPTCPPSCDMYCEHGNQVDEAGCDICACNDPPSTTAPASNACTMTALIPLVTQMSQSCMYVASTCNAYHDRPPKYLCAPHEPPLSHRNGPLLATVALARS